MEEMYWHNSSLDKGSVRYGEDLEDIQEKWGGQGLCFILFPRGETGRLGEWSGLDVPGFSGGPANPEGEVKKNHYKDNG